jgi:hypothetical protein
MAAEKEYDVGITFLSRDAALATELAAALLPLKVFVYPKRQEELAGKNGVEEFREAFRHKVRVPVILHREGWGSTPFTQVEELAIQEYLLREAAWGRQMLVKLDQSPSPGWIPGLYIHFDLTTFPMSQLVGAIKAKVLESGGTVRVATAADIAAQHAAEEAFDRETIQMLRSSGAIFFDLAGQLFGELEKQIAEIVTSTGWKLVRAHDRGEFVAFLDPVSFQLLPREVYSNDSKDAHFKLRWWLGKLMNPAERARGGMYLDNPQEIASDLVKPWRDPVAGWGWDVAGRRVSHSEAARLILAKFLERRKNRLRS